MIDKQEMAVTPEARAEAAARDLADRGRSVTARAVREVAGVRMAVAAVAARAWREAQADESEVQVPETPADVRSRLDAVWADAYRAAVASVTPERDRLAAEVGELRGEVDALTATVEDVEAERDERFARLEEAEQARAAVVSERDDASARASRAEDRAESVETERDRLAAQVAALIERIPSATEMEEG